MQDQSRYIDVEDGLHRIAGNKAIYKKLLAAFSAKTGYEQLAADMAKGDREAATRGAHTIKGVAANLSLPALREAAFALETALKAGEDGEAERASLQSAQERTLACIAHVLETLT